MRQELGVERVSARWPVSSLFMFGGVLLVLVGGAMLVLQVTRMGGLVQRTSAGMVVMMVVIVAVGAGLCYWGASGGRRRIRLFEGGLSVGARSLSFSEMTHVDLSTSSELAALGGVVGGLVAADLALGIVFRARDPQDTLGLPRAVCRSHAQEVQALSRRAVRALAARAEAELAAGRPYQSLLDVELTATDLRCPKDSLMGKREWQAVPVAEIERVVGTAIMTRGASTPAASSRAPHVDPVLRELLTARGVKFVQPMQ